MPDAEADPPIVGLPERLDRRLRLGPFPSGREALKFVVFAAIGAVLVPVAGVGIWVVFLVAGLAVSLWRPDGIPLDARLLAVARWELRRTAPGAPMTASPDRPRGAAVVPLAAGGYAAVVRASGVPLAYLPPAELRRRFELYRDLLRAVDGSLVVLAARAPIHAEPFVPPPDPAVGAPVAAARAGYRELVELIVRRRAVRQVFVGLPVPENGPESLRRLEDRVDGVIERMAGLGLAPVRLKDRALAEAARRVGFDPDGRAA